MKGKAKQDADMSLPHALDSPPHDPAVGTGTPMQMLPLVKASMYDGASKVLSWNAGPAYDTVAARVSWHTSDVKTLGTAGEQRG